MRIIFLYISVAMICFTIVVPINYSQVLAGMVNTNEVIQKIAVIPFTVNGNKNKEYLQKGILQMLDSRLSWSGHVKVVPGVDTQQILKGFNGKTDFEKAKKVADRINTSFVITGSVTCLGDSFSLDVKLFDMHEKRYMPFFEQSDTSEVLIDKIDRICAMINKHAFSRTTVTWDTMLQEQKASENEMRRRNPEYLMENPAWQTTKESYGWKFWKRWL